MKMGFPLDTRKAVYQNSHFIANYSVILFSVYKTDASGQLANKQYVIQSKPGRKSFPERFHILHHS